ncbi:unnamed protein product [Oikopleura dioica]|uniref:Uncharacterized protein n=1 Tax=Oikopleura dioica TaxID=34765 RepID=E4YVR6_OIKDI|nr:unnamed protein product [Oikopleura dioica]
MTKLLNLMLLTEFFDPITSPPLELFSDDSDYEELKQKRDERFQFMNEEYSRISGHSDVSSGSSGILLNCGAATFNDEGELTPRSEKDDSVATLNGQQSLLILAVSAGTKSAYEVFTLSICSYNKCRNAAARAVTRVRECYNTAYAFYKDWVQLYPDEKRILAKRIFQVYYYSVYGDLIKVFLAFCFAFVLFSFKVY